MPDARMLMTWERRFHLPAGSTDLGGPRRLETRIDAHTLVTQVDDTLPEHALDAAK